MCTHRRGQSGACVREVSLGVEIGHAWKFCMRLCHPVHMFLHYYFLLAYLPRTASKQASKKPRKPQKQDSPERKQGSKKARQKETKEDSKKESTNKREEGRKKEIHETNNRIAQSWPSRKRQFVTHSQERLPNCDLGLKISGSALVKRLPPSRSWVHLLHCTEDTHTATSQVNHNDPSKPAARLGVKPGWIAREPGWTTRGFPERSG